MPRYDASTAECLVFSYKEGLLAKVAHDLKIQVDRFQVSVDEGSRAIEATFEVGSMRVVCARKDGRDAPGTLSKGDLKKIYANITEDVIDARRHPQVRFVSRSVEEQGDRATIEGSLTLNGRERPLRVVATKQGGKWVADVRIHQPDFGIKPFSAMMGALKVQPHVDVRLSLPA